MEIKKTFFFIVSLFFVVITDFSFMPSSVATTLGLTRVSAQTLKLVNEHTVFSEVVTDQEAVKAVERFVGEYDLNSCAADLKCHKISCETDLSGVSSLCR